MTIKAYQAIRRVTRLDYLIIVLKNAQKGYEQNNALRDIQESQKEIETRKAKVLGKRKARPVRGGAVLRESEKMAMQMRYLTRNGDSFTLTDEGAHLLQVLSNDDSTMIGDEARKLLIPRFWRVYPKFRRAIMAICNQTKGTMDLPLPSDASFNDVILDKYNHECDAISFKIIREISEQLELINWYIINQNDDRLQRVYAICCVAVIDNIASLGGNFGGSESFSDECNFKIGVRTAVIVASEEGKYGEEARAAQVIENTSSSGMVIVQGEKDKIIIDRYYDVKLEEFEEKLWTKYLELVNYRPLFPALYPELRNIVCYELRISDKAFDRAVLDLIKKPMRINVYPSVGILDYSRRFAHLHKYIPPQTTEGRFITYIKIKRAN